MLLRAVAACALLAALAVSCAPRLGPQHGPQSTVDGLAARYGAACDLRAAALHAYTAQLVVRADGRMVGRVPALIASLALSAPDRMRIRASWLLGTAFEMVALDDSVFAWVPSQHTGVTLGSAGQAIGVRAPIALVCRALGATWEPPSAAWRAAVADSAGWTLAWMEEGDSLQMQVGRDARPKLVRLAREGGEVRVRYTSWETWRDAPWPQRIEIADGSGWARIRIEMEQPHMAKRPDPHAFALHVPNDARIVDWRDLRSLLGLQGDKE